VFVSAAANGAAPIAAGRRSGPLPCSASQQFADLRWHATSQKNWPRKGWLVSGAPSHSSIDFVLQAATAVLLIYTGATLLLSTGSMPCVNTLLTILMILLLSPTVSAMNPAQIRRCVPGGAAALVVAALQLAYPAVAIGALFGQLADLTDHIGMPAAGIPMVYPTLSEIALAVLFSAWGAAGGAILGSGRHLFHQHQQALRPTRACTGLFEAVQECTDIWVNAFYLMCMNNAACGNPFAEFMEIVHWSMTHDVLVRPCTRTQPGEIFSHASCEIYLGFWGCVGYLGWLMGNVVQGAFGYGLSQCAETAEMWQACLDAADDDERWTRRFVLWKRCFHSMEPLVCACIRKDAFIAFFGLGAIPLLKMCQLCSAAFTIPVRNAQGHLTEFILVCAPMK
jgi:hypothetical protein